MGYVPERGDVVWLSFDPQAGHEQSGRRPALTLSPRAYNEKVGLGLFCPVTSQIKGYPFEILIPPGYPVSGAILSDHVKSLDWSVREAEFAVRMPPHIVESVLRTLMLLLD